MKTRPLGRTGLSVTELCLGTMTWGHQNTEAEAHEQMDYAIDHGINFFDTAELYAVPPSPETQGKTEEYIGTWFKKTGSRDKVILASKVAGVGLPWIREGAPISAKGIKEAVEGNLRRLQTDYIDLYQLHWPNRDTYKFGNHAVEWTQNAYAAERENIHNCLIALNDLVKEGKLRHFGLSNDTAWGLMQHVREAEQYNLPRVASVQNEYSLMWRWNDKDVAEVCVAEDIAYLTYSSLAGGVLSGKYLDGKRPSGARYSISQRNMHRVTSDGVDAAVRDYIALAKKYNVDVCQMALAWCLTRPFVTSVILGATSMDQLKSDIAAEQMILPSEMLAEIDVLYARHAMPF